MYFDVFISYRSLDREFALSIQKGLLTIDSNISVFLAENTLEEIASSDYTTAIEEAIKSSRNMIVVGTNAENIVSRWVMHEWRLFQHYQLSSDEGFYKNLVTATPSSVDILTLPDALQICENIEITDFRKLYKYAKNIDQTAIDKIAALHGYANVRHALSQIGWEQTLFITPIQLSEYESSIKEQLSTVTIISHSLEEDCPGGALFETVANNLAQGIQYNYIFLEANRAQAILKKIYNGHCDSVRKMLLLETAKESFWVFEDYANVTIYEFKDGKAPEAYIRIKAEVNRGIEKSVFIRVSEQFVDRILNKLELLRHKRKIKKYR